MRVIQATDQELQALAQLLHRAVQHSGMEVAEVALFWNRKIMMALTTPPPPPPEKTETPA